MTAFSKRTPPSDDRWPNRLLPLFQDHPRLTFKVQDIERTLQVAKKDRVALHKQLRDLVRTGEIFTVDPV